MNKAFFILLFGCISILGCNDIYPNKSASPTDTGGIGGQKLLESIASTYTDSFIAVEQKKVIKDLTFGMSKKETDKILQKFKMVGEDGYGYYIGRHKYDEIKGCYLDDSLYELIVQGTGKRIVGDKLLDALDGVSDDYSTYADWKFYELSKLLKSKYGEPTVNTHSDMVNNAEMKWTIGIKTVLLSLSKYDNSGHIYLEISLPDVLKRAIQKDNNKSNHITDSISKSIFK